MKVIRLAFVIRINVVKIKHQTLVHITADGFHPVPVMPVLPQYFPYLSQKLLKYKDIFKDLMY